MQFCFFADNSNASQACSTVNGTLCILPFRYNGNLFDTCQPYPGTAEHWCATVVSNDSEFVNSPGNWGICEPACPIVASQNLGKVYSSFEKIDSPKDSIEFQSKDVAWSRKFYFT